jgi:hypothetical protein
MSGENPDIFYPLRILHYLIMIVKTVFELGGEQ